MDPNKANPQAVDAVMDHFARLREQDDLDDLTARIYFRLPDWIKAGRLRLAERLADAEIVFDERLERVTCNQGGSRCD